MSVSGALKLGFSILVATSASRLESDGSESVDLGTEQAVDVDADTGDMLAAARRSRAELANWVAVNESGVHPDWGHYYHASAPPTPFRLSAYPRGELLMYWHGKEFPVCGHEFKYSHAGAAHVCRTMGYTGGVIHFHAGWRLEHAALFVGKCHPGEVPGVNCSGGDTCGYGQRPAMSCDKCQQGQENVVEVECFTHPFKEGEVLLYPSWGDNGFVEGELQMFKFGNFHPVCSVGFTSNDFGADMACKALGYQHGHKVPIIPGLGHLEKDALMVGACPQHAWDLSHCNTLYRGRGCKPNGLGCDRCMHNTSSLTVVRCATQQLHTLWVGHMRGHAPEPISLTPDCTLPTHTNTDDGWSSRTYPNLASHLPKIHGHFTMAFAVTFYNKDSWARVVDIGKFSDDIYVSRKGGESKITFGMTVGGTPYTITVPITENKEERFVWSVAADGIWKLWKDGTLLKDEQQRAPAENHISVAYLGKSIWSFDKLFRGEIKDFKLWSATLSWDRVFGNAGPSAYTNPASIVSSPRDLMYGYNEVFPFSVFERQVAGSTAFRVQSGHSLYTFYAFHNGQPGTALYTMAKDHRGNFDIVEGDGYDLPDDLSEKKHFWAYP